MCVTWTRGIGLTQECATRRRSARAHHRGRPPRRHASPAARRPPGSRVPSPPRADRGARSSFPPAGAPSRRSLRSSVLLPVHGSLELVLVHVRAALDVQLLRLVVELVARTALLAVGARPLAPAVPWRLRSARRRLGRGPGLAVASAFLVDGARSD